MAWPHQGHWSEGHTAQWPGVRGGEVESLQERQQWLLFVPTLGFYTCYWIISNLPNSLQGKHHHSYFILFVEDVQHWYFIIQIRFTRKSTLFKNKIITMFVLCTFPSYATFPLNVSPSSCLGLKFFNFNIHQGKINILRCKQEKE